MLNWIMTVVVVLIGFLVMVTGLIEYLFMGYLAYLLRKVRISRSFLPKLTR